MEHEAVFRFTSLSAPAIYESLLPETESEVNPRSVASVQLEGTDTLILTIRAEDIPAFRASLNMWLRLVNVADEMILAAENR